MPQRLEIKDFLALARRLPVFDVRSPMEYVHGHIPDAVSFPLFSDEERAEVGKTYHQRGREDAVRKGLHIVGPHLDAFVNQAMILAPGREVLVYCWRGGMRSASIAWLLETAGFTVTLLDKGYKSFRGHVLKGLTHSYPLLVLGGMTGSGKTRVLLSLHDLGQQTIDLEGLAGHKGSAFGHIGLPPQPTTEHFENELLWQLEAIDATHGVWVEDESITIGNVHLPKPFFLLKNSSPMILLDLPLEYRVERLVEEYAEVDNEGLALSIREIQSKLGNDVTELALKSLRAGDFATTARILLQYYDKAYRYALRKKALNRIFPLTVKGRTPSDIALEVLDFVTSNSRQLYSDG